LLSSPQIHALNKSWKLVSLPSDCETRGIHHITAIASDPQRNVDFYTQILGLRLAKRTVNFDDPSTYHFYFGDRTGRPGSTITFLRGRARVAGSAEPAR